MRRKALGVSQRFGMASVPARVWLALMRIAPLKL